MKNFKANFLAVIARVTSITPRVKGLGIIIGYIASYFKYWDIEVKSRVFGNFMILNSSDYIGNLVLFSPNYYDRRERKLIDAIVREGDYVVDVGANIGIYTLLLARLVSQGGEVIAIEAERANLAKLRTNIALNEMDWIKVAPFGVSDKDETLMLNLNQTGNAGAHSFVVKPHEAAYEAQTVKCVRLATVLDADRAPRFMKLDIEGFEYRVLKAYFEEVGDSMKPDYIMLEDNSLRENDAVALTLASGYRLLKRVDDNVFFIKQSLNSDASDAQRKVVNKKRSSQALRSS